MSSDLLARTQYACLMAPPDYTVAGDVDDGPAASCLVGTTSLQDRARRAIVTIKFSLSTEYLLRAEARDVLEGELQRSPLAGAHVFFCFAPGCDGDVPGCDSTLQSQTPCPPCDRHARHVVDRGMRKPPAAYGGTRSRGCGPSLG